MDAKHQIHTLSKHKGQYVLIYFYPKDDTPGCTKEACAFRDNQETLLKNQVLVYGISRDSAESHAKFSQKYDLNFTLLSDPELKAHKAYGVLEENKTKRSTFLIDKKGNIFIRIN
jgi:peroxiredoxin Q/BCP